MRIQFDRGFYLKKFQVVRVQFESGFYSNALRFQFYDIHLLFRTLSSYLVRFEFCRTFDFFLNSFNRISGMNIKYYANLHFAYVEFE